MTQQLPPKKEVALALLERSNVDVYLDPRARGVVVPPQFRKEPRLILKIGLNMPVPIPDLRLDEDSMSCTLSFNRSPFYCVVPWSSVFAMVGEDGRGMVWPDDVPQELAVKVVDEGAPADGPSRAPSRPRAVESASPSPARRGDARRGSKPADEPPASESPSRGPAGRRKKKKDEERPRPVLVSVAPDPASASASSAPAAHGSRRPGQRDGVSAIPSARSSGSDASQSQLPTAPPGAPSASPRRPAEGPARPKRELPPYLRVVK